MEDVLKKIKSELSKDPEIVSFVREHEITSEVVDRNLSILYQQKQANDICRNCMGKKTCAMEAYLWKPELEFHHGNINQRLRRCPYVDTFNEDLLEMLFVPDDYQSGKVDGTKERMEVLSEIKRFVENPTKAKGLYIHGQFGTGKTYILLHLAQELTKMGLRVVFAYYPDLVRHVKASIATNAVEPLVVKLKEADVLMLDDIGGENNTSFVRDEVLGPILQYRMLGNKPTFMTSNLGLNELRLHFTETRDGVDKIKSDRIIERISFLMKEVQLTGKNYRQNL